MVFLAVTLFSINRFIAVKYEKLPIDPALFQIVAFLLYSYVSLSRYEIN
jgi:hypothetical protein